MSNETEHLHTAEHGEARSKPAHEVDIEGEHRRDVARRASLIGLRKNQSKISDASTDEKREQWVVANEAGSKAISLSLRFAANQLQVVGDKIEHIVAAPLNEAGIDLPVRMLQEELDKVRDIVHRVTGEVNAANTHRIPETDDMRRDMYAFERAYVAFGRPLKLARDFAHRDPHQQLRFDTSPMDKEVNGMFETRKIKFADLQDKIAQSGSAKLPRPGAEPTAHVFAQALGANVDAMMQTAHLLRMRLTASSDEHLEPTVQRLISHVNEIAALVETADKKTIKPHAAAILKAMRELDRLEQELAVKPALGRKIGPGTTTAESMRRISASVPR